ncbi:MAG TPA: hypothetical protein DIU00_00845, partial [Phycisphaerales bacterium]|nr:hypothetical protein [Phycisphaerales bacterium]
LLTCPYVVRAGKKNPDEGYKRCSFSFHDLLPPKLSMWATIALLSEPLYWCMAISAAAIITVVVTSFNIRLFIILPRLEIMTRAE